MTAFNTSFKKVISSSASGLFFRMFGLGTSFLSIVLISRLFGLDDFGRYSLIFTVCQACAMIFALGIPTALIKLVGSHNLDVFQARRLLVKGIRVAAVFVALPIVFFYFGAEFLSVSIFSNASLEPYFLMIVVALPVSILHELFLYFFVATRKFMLFNLFMFVFPNIFLIIFLLLFFYSGYSGFFTFLAFVFGILLTVIIESVVVFTQKYPQAQVTISARELLIVASPMMFSSLLLYLLNWTDVIILGMMVDEKQVGIYNIAYKVGSVGFLIIVSVSTIITPMMAQLYGAGDINGLKKVIQDATRLIAIATIPIFAGLIIFSSFILSFFNAEAVAGTTTLFIVASGVLISALAGNVDQILNMSNNQHILRNITFVCFFLNLILNLILIPILGINGSAVASLITNIVLNLICLYYVKKKLGFYTLRLTSLKK